MSDTKSINEHIVIVSPEFHLWSGRRAMKADKLKAYNPQGIDLPPTDLASLGSVKLVDPNELKPFDKMKDDVHRLLASKGLRLFGGYAIHEDTFPEVFKELQSRQAAFETLRADLLVSLDANIQQWVTDWVARNPGNQYLLQNLPTAQSVFGKMSFDFHSYRIAPPADDAQHNESSSDYRTKLQGLRGELYREAAKEASVLMTEYLVNDNGNKRDYVTQKTLRPIKRIAERLRQFTFVDSAAGPLADVIDWTMNQVPAEGRVDGPGLMAVWNMARLLSNPDEAARLGEIASANGAENAWDIFQDDFMREAEPLNATVEPAKQVNAAAELMAFESNLDSFQKAHSEAIQLATQASIQDEAKATFMAQAIVLDAPQAMPQPTEPTPAPVIQPTSLASDAMGFLF